MEVHLLFAEAYAVTRGETLVLQLVSLASRSLPQLPSDTDGNLSVPMAKAEEVFVIFDEAGIDLKVLG
jgi:hypothetical protein